MRRTLLAGLTFTLASLVAGHSQAAVNQITLMSGGQTCVPLPNYPASIINEFGSLNSSASADQKVVCPVPQYLSGGLNSVSVFVYDRSRSEDVTCWLNEIPFGGGEMTVASGSSAGVKHSGFWSFPLTPTSSTGTLPVVVICLVPKQDTGGGTGTFSGIQSIEAIYNSQQ
jgi:hypothetical protein